MRVALISDIHGNLPALDAVLADIDASHPVVERIICLGDLVDLGPQPREVVDRIRSRGIPCVRGNHDALTDDVLFPGAPPLLRAVLEQNRRVLDGDDRRYLEALPPSICLDLPSEDNEDREDDEVRHAPKVLCVHGSPRSDEEGIVAGLTDSELDEILCDISDDFDVLACGHTHVQMLRRWRGKTLVNAGSVGCPFERAYGGPGEPPVVCPWAEYAILDCRGGSSQYMRVELRRVRFDLKVFCNAVMDAFGTENGQAWLRHYKDIQLKSK